MPCRPASRLIIKNGYPDQMLMKVSAHSAVLGSASQLTSAWRKPTAVRRKLTTPNGSSMSRQMTATAAIVNSHGRIDNAEDGFGQSTQQPVLSIIAKASPRTRWAMVLRVMKMKVFLIAVQKTGSVSTLV